MPNKGARVNEWLRNSKRPGRSKAMQKNRDNREAMRDQMKKDREAADAELKKVLTEEQYKTYKANEEKRMKEWQQRGRQGGGHPQR